MTVELDEARRKALVAGVQALFQEEFDQELSAFRAERVLDHLLESLGPAVYNQAVQDARKYFQRALDDLDGEVYRSEPL